MEIPIHDTQEYVSGIPESGDLIWISKRINPTKAMNNKYGVIGGKIEQDEIPIQALKREAKKEVNVEIQDIYFLNTKEYTKEEKYLSRKRIVHTYIIRIKEIPTRMEPHNMEE